MHTRRSCERMQRTWRRKEKICTGTIRRSHKQSEIINMTHSAAYAYAQKKSITYISLLSCGTSSGSFWEKIRSFHCLRKKKAMVVLFFFLPFFRCYFFCSVPWIAVCVCDRVCLALFLFINISIGALTLFTASIMISARTRKPNVICIFSFFPNHFVSTEPLHGSHTK